MNGRAIPVAYLFRLYVCDKEMSWPHHIGETHQPDWVVYVRDSEKFRLTNVIPERIIFVSRGITVHLLKGDICSVVKIMFVLLITLRWNIALDIPKIIRVFVDPSSFVRSVWYFLLRSSLSVSSINALMESHCLSHSTVSVMCRCHSSLV